MKHFAQSSVVVAVAVILSSSCAFAEESPPPFHYSDDWTLVSAPPPTGPYRSVYIDPRIPGAGTVEPMPVIPPQLREKGGTAEEPSAPTGEAAAAQEVPPARETPAPEETAAPQTIPPPQAMPAQEAPATTGQAPAPVAPEYAASIPGTAPAAGVPVSQGMEAPPLETVPSNVPPPAAGPGEEYGQQGREPGAQMPPAPQPALRGYGRTMPPPQMRNYNYPTPWYPYQPRYPGSRNVPPPGYYTPQRSNEEPEVPPPPAYEGAYRRPPYPGGSGW